jgi:hypothetical protein
VSNLTNGFEGVLDAGVRVRSEPERLLHRGHLEQVGRKPDHRVAGHDGRHHRRRPLPGAHRLQHEQNEALRRRATHAQVSLSLCPSHPPTTPAK